MLEYLKKIPSTPAQVTAAIDEVLRLYKASVESKKGRIAALDRAYAEAGIESGVSIKVKDKRNVLFEHILLVKSVGHGNIKILDDNNHRWTLQKWNVENIEVVK